MIVSLQIYYLLQVLVYGRSSTSADIIAYLAEAGEDTLYNFCSSTAASYLFQVHTACICMSVLCVSVMYYIMYSCNFPLYNLAFLIQVVAVVRDVDGHILNSLPSELVSTYVSQDGKHPITCTQQEN